MFRLFSIGILGTFGLNLAFSTLLCMSASAEEKDHKMPATTARFLAILEKNPRRGTSFDKVFQYYVETGNIDRWVERLHNQLEENPENGKAALLLGMVQSRRGEEKPSCESFEQSAKSDPKSAVAAYYWGEMLLRLGQMEKAAEVLESASRRNPSPKELQEILQHLGRTYLRLGEREKANATWKRLKDAFPDNLEVVEIIAETYLREEKWNDALHQYQHLASRTPEASYDRVRYVIEIGDIKVAQGKTEESIEQFEQLLDRLAPESWLAEMVRDRIDNVFARQYDWSGLVEYYETRLEKHPQELVSMRRLGQALLRVGRVNRAQETLERALSLAPSNEELRLELIDILVYQKRFLEAAEQYEALIEIHPNHRDYLEQWGLLVLEKSDKPLQERKATAEKIWRRILQSAPEDPSTIVFVADLFDQAEMFQKAEALYRKAVDLSPNALQYHEYLGNFYYRQENREKALASWRKMIEGGSESKEAYSLLLEILSRYDYLEEAIEVAEKACDYAPEELDYHFQKIELLLLDEQNDQASKMLQTIRKEVETDHQWERYAESLLKCHEESLEEFREELSAQVKKKPYSEKTPGIGHWLAGKVALALADYDQVESSFATARKKDPDSSLFAESLASHYEKQGKETMAIEVYRQMIEKEPALRSEHLKKIARLQSKIGHFDEAIGTAKQVLATGVANPESFKFYSNLCLEYGKLEKAIDSLQQAIQANPGEKYLILQLSQLLDHAGRPAEAIELVWSVYEKEDDFQQKMELISRLSKLYLSMNRFDHLIARLKRAIPQTRAQSRLHAFSLAMAYRSVEDVAQARSHLEEILPENQEDIFLLQDLSSLAEEMADLPGAIRYQKRICKLSGQPQHRQRLFELYLKNQQRPQASDLLQVRLEELEEPAKQISLLKELFTAGEYDLAIEAIELLKKKDPRNWEWDYFEIIVLATKKEKEAFRQKLEDFRKREIPWNATAPSSRGKKPTVAKPASHQLPPTHQLMMAQMSARNQQSIPSQISDAFNKILDPVLRRKHYQLQGIRANWHGTPFSALPVPKDGLQAHLFLAHWRIREAFESEELLKLIEKMKQEYDSGCEDPRRLFDHYILMSSIDHHNFRRILSEKHQKMFDRQWKWDVLTVLAQDAPDRWRNPFLQQYFSIFTEMVRRKQIAQASDSKAPAPPNAPGGPEEKLPEIQRHHHLLCFELLREMAENARLAEILPFGRGYLHGDSEFQALLKKEMEKVGVGKEYLALRDRIQEKVEEVVPAQHARLEELMGSFMKDDYDHMLELLQKNPELIGHLPTALKIPELPDVSIVQYSPPSAGFIPHHPQIAPQEESRDEEEADSLTPEEVFETKLKPQLQFHLFRLEPLLRQENSPFENVDASMVAPWRNPSRNYTSYLDNWVRQTSNALESRSSHRGSYSTSSFGGSRFGMSPVRSHSDFQECYSDFFDLTTTTRNLFSHEIFLPHGSIQYPDMPVDLQEKLREERMQYRQLFFDYLEEQIANRKGREKEIAQKVLAYLEFLTEDQEEQFATLLQKFQSLEEPSEKMRFFMIDLLLKEDEFTEVIGILESLETTSGEVLKKKEQLILNCCLLSDDSKWKDRARQAAQRLYGFRLNEEQQKRLIQSLRILEMDSLADTLLSRLVRVSRNAHSLLWCLQKLSESGHEEELVMIAQRILRLPASTPNSHYLKKMAYTELEKLGLLENQIEKLEAQWKAAPGSHEIMKSLVIAYHKEGETAKAEGVIRQYLQDLPDDPEKIEETIGLLIELDDYQRAVFLIKSQLYEDPSLILTGNISWSYRRAFSETDQKDWIFSQILKCDPEKYPAIMQNSSRWSEYFNDSWTHQVDEEIIKKAWIHLWQCFDHLEDRKYQQRTQFLSNMRFARLPEKIQPVFLDKIWKMMQIGLKEDKSVEWVCSIDSTSSENGIYYFENEWTKWLMHLEDPAKEKELEKLLRARLKRASREEEESAEKQPPTGRTALRVYSSSHGSLLVSENQQEEDTAIESAYSRYMLLTLLLKAKKQKEARKVWEEMHANLEKSLEEPIDIQPFYMSGLMLYQCPGFEKESRECLELISQLSDNSNMHSHWRQQAIEQLMTIYIEAGELEKLQQLVSDALDRFERWHKLFEHEGDHKHFRRLSSYFILFSQMANLMLKEDQPEIFLEINAGFLRIARPFFRKIEDRGNQSYSHEIDQYFNAVERVLTTVSPAQWAEHPEWLLPVVRAEEETEWKVFPSPWNDASLLLEVWQDEQNRIQMDCLGVNLCEFLEREERTEEIALYRRLIAQLRQDDPEDLSLLLTETIFACYFAEEAERREAIARCVEWIESHPVKTNDQKMAPHIPYRFRMMEARKHQWQLAFWVPVRYFLENDLPMEPCLEADLVRLAERSLESCDQIRAYPGAYHHSVQQQQLKWSFLCRLRQNERFRENLASEAAMKQFVYDTVKGFLVDEKGVFIRHESEDWRIILEWVPRLISRGYFPQVVAALDESFPDGYWPKSPVGEKKPSSKQRRLMVALLYAANEAAVENNDNLEDFYAFLENLVLPENSPTSIFFGAYDTEGRLASRSDTLPLLLVRLARRTGKLSQLEERIATREANEEQPGILATMKMILALETGREEKARECVDLFLTLFDEVEVKKQVHLGHRALLALAPVHDDMDKIAPVLPLIVPALEASLKNGKEQLPNYMRPVLPRLVHHAIKQNDLALAATMADYYRLYWKRVFKERIYPDHLRFRIDQKLSEAVEQALASEKPEEAIPVLRYFADEPIDSFRRLDLSEWLDRLETSVDALPEDFDLACYRRENTMFLEKKNADSPKTADRRVHVWTKKRAESLSGLPELPTGKEIYAHDFEKPVGREWSLDRREITPVEGRTFLGQFSGISPENQVDLTLKDLPTHELLVVRFDLMLFQFWEGLPYDRWKLQVDERLPVIETSFFSSHLMEREDRDQLWPDSLPEKPNRVKDLILFVQQNELMHPKFTGATEVDSLGYGQGMEDHDSPSYRVRQSLFGGSDSSETDKPLGFDMVYPIEVVIPHRRDTAKLTFSATMGEWYFVANCLDPSHQEGWGLDNVRVQAVAKRPEFSKKQLQDCWNALKGPPVAAQRAAQILIAAGPEALKFVEKQSPPEPARQHRWKNLQKILTESTP